MSDTPDTTRGTTPKLLLSGIDTLEAGYFIDGLGLDWADLAYRRERIRQERQPFQEIELGGERFALLPRGGAPYSYVLKHKAFTLRLAEHMQPRAHVKFHSEALWTQGLEAVLGRVMALFDAIGTRITRPEIISRVDLAYDFELGEVDFDTDSFVSRIRKNCRWCDSTKRQSFQFGKGDIVWRVYDKVAEIKEESGKTWLYDLWGQKENVWRVEVQVRRDRLKTAGIRTIENLCAFKGDLIRELATNHTTLRIPTDDNNSSRWPLHPLWLALLEAIEGEPQTGLIEAIDPESSLNYRLQRQLKSLQGDLKALAALLGLFRQPGAEDEVISLNELLWRLPTLLKPYYHKTLWHNDVNRRLAKGRHGL